ncbi:MAG: RNA-binding protein [Clostridiales bacterium]|jgi:RNA-binding protein|nr:RNA-binding protein [Clostridiales bacterium]
MINSKQRAWLRAMANDMSCQFQVGKGEIDEDIIRGLDEILTTHELLKINVLKTAAEPVKDIANTFADSTGADIVQVIGRRIVLYRFSQKLAKKGQSLKLPY